VRREKRWSRWLKSVEVFNEQGEAQQLKLFPSHVEPPKEDWTQVRPDMEVKQVTLPQGNETYILCRTVGRKEKEKAIRNRFPLGWRML
jgi:hypothetical protein